MPFAALDLHRQVVQAILIDDQGATLHQDRFPATREALLEFAQRHLSKTTKLTLEATCNTWPVVTLLEPFVQEVGESSSELTSISLDKRSMLDSAPAEVLLPLPATKTLL